LNLKTLFTNRFALVQTDQVHQIPSLKLHTVQSEKPTIIWTLVRNKDQAPLGFCTLSKIDQLSSNAVIDFAFVDSVSSQSYLLECLRLVINWVRAEYAIVHIDVAVVKGNRLAINVLSSLGFKTDGFALSLPKATNSVEKLLLFRLNVNRN
jgi:RimJ/RimL family protein N-acetyltransferase